MSFATPRLSILLPVPSTRAASERTAWEETLVSVLENRPAACEVLIVHDGTYEDPFELGDEARFAVADSSALVDCIAAGCDTAWGRYVHVLTAGMKVTPQWCDHALPQFEDFDVAAVAPLIRYRDDQTILAAGWTDVPGRLMDPIGSGENSLHALSIPTGKRAGVYLDASFWRREVLRSLTRACAPTDPLVANYSYHHLCSSQGWRCVVAANSVLTTDRDLAVDQSSAGRGRTLRSIRNHFCRGGAGTAAMGAVRGLLAGEIGESIGQATAAISPVKVAKWFNVDAVHSGEQYELVRRA